MFNFECQTANVDYYQLSNKDFQGYLNKLYNNNNQALIEYAEPYSGRLGSYKAEIYCDDIQTKIINNIVKKITSLGLTKKFEGEKGDTDVIVTSVGTRGGNKQIIFTSNRALDLFKQAILKDVGVTFKTLDYTPDGFELIWK